MSDFNAANMPTTPRHGIRYPGPTDLVRHASQQFKAMAESIDDNIDKLPAQITARVDDAATRAAASATAAQQAAASAGTLADQNMAANINNTSSQTAAAMDKWRNAGNRWHNAVIIGDSLCKGYYSGAEHAGQGIGDVICKNLGIDTVQNMAVSGSGFTVGGDNTFVQQWNRVSNKKKRGPCACHRRRERQQHRLQRGRHAIAELHQAVRAERHHIRVPSRRRPRHGIA